MFEDKPAMCAEGRLLWVVEFCCGCCGYRFPSFCCSPCVSTEAFEGAVMEALVVERSGPAGAPESSKSAVSWPAIIAGAVAATAATVLLLVLGSGFGLISASPWPGNGASAGKVVALAAIWFIVVQWVASFLGGYLTGRLRTKWVGTHTHEVFFRDTLHGFIAW